MKTSLAALLLSFVSFIPNVTATTTWPELTKEWRKSTVYLSFGAEAGVCTGFVVDGFNKLVQTAAHCIGAETYADGYNTELFTKDINNDLALLRVPDLPMGYRNARLASKDPEQGEELLSIGYGDGYTTPMVRRSIVSLLDILIKPKEGPKGPYMVIDAALVNGMSGGPVINMTGEVVGIISRSSDRAGLVVSSKIIRKSTGKHWTYK